MDDRTLLMAIVVFNGMFAVFFGVLSFYLQRTRWLRYWSTASVLFLFAFLLMMFRGKVYPLLTVYLPNLLLILATLFLLAGVDLVVGKKRNILVYAIFPVLLTLGYALIGLSMERVLPRQLLVCPLYAGVFGLMSLSLFSALPMKTRFPFVLTGLVAGLVAFSHFFRFGFTLQDMILPGGHTPETHWKAALAGALGITFLMYSCLVTLTAITIQKELALSVDRLAKSNRNRDRLISILSHELDGSVRTIGGMLRNFVKEDIALMSEASALLMRKLQTLSVEQRGMLTNVLHWLQYQRDGIRPRPELCRVSSFVSELASMALEMAETKGVRVDVAVMDDREVRMDPEMVRTILRNLLSNAVKFTPAGGSVRLAVAEQTEAVVFTVSDTGTGFDTGEPRSIQDGLKPSRGTSGEKGSGLGLQICRDFTARLGGRLLIQSEIGKGTMAELRLPIYESRCQSF